MGVQRLGLPFLYGSPYFVNAVALESFASRILEQPSLGSHIRTIAFASYMDTPHYSQAKITQLILHILSKFHPLYAFAGLSSVLATATLCSLGFVPAIIASKT